MTSLSM